MMRRGLRPVCTMLTLGLLTFGLWVGACAPPASDGSGQDASGGIQASGPLAVELDSAARAHVESPMVPGVSVAVVRGDETLLQRGYGFVDLEWDVPTPADGRASYQIGSVTKQFTAAAVLLLAEEGLVDLDADFTEYVDFDTRGRSIPLRRLLDHTSGVKGYTEMEVFRELSIRDLPRDTLVRLVEAEPLEFEPGTALIYNNSAYFLLGLIVEEVSGMPYEDFVAERLFEPADMDDSYYCDELAVRDGRAHGYDVAAPDPETRADDGPAASDSLIRARYLDHTWPYSAGSLCSTVDDLVAWNRSLHGGRLLTDASYEAMTTPAPLEDGTAIRYAMGLSVDTLWGGRRVIAHGGGINGFVSALAYYPEEDLTVVVLQNAAAQPGAGALAGELAEIVLGPAAEPDEVAFEGDLEGLAGVYRGPARGRTLTLRVSAEDGALSIREGEEGDDLAIREGEEDEDPVTPSYRGDVRWEDGNVRYIFARDGDLYIFVRDGDRIGELRMDHGGGHYVLARVEG